MESQCETHKHTQSHKHTLTRTRSPARRDRTIQADSGQNLAILNQNQVINDISWKDVTLFGTLGSLAGWLACDISEAAVQLIYDTTAAGECT